VNGVVENASQVQRACFDFSCGNIFMENQSIFYSAIIFLALIFGDLGVTGIASISGPLAALLLELEAWRKQRKLAKDRFTDA
jgi:hypothetical protein